MKILVTGGAGYIGSTIASALLDSGKIPVILDSLITGRGEFTEERIFYHGDIADKEVLKKIFHEHPDISFVIHCAGLIVVPESVERPYDYYYENVIKSVELFRNLHELGCDKFIFSSSASIYDDVPGFMVTEQSPLRPRSPYAKTKYLLEMILQDFCMAYHMQGISLRYFNPIGADPRMRSGEYKKDPSHVLGKLVNVALGREKVFRLTGVNWPTRDGSGIRDFIHVWDLASAHVHAIENFDRAFENASERFIAINLGTGKGLTVKELVTAFEKVHGKEIPKEEAPPRPGDVAGSFTNADKAMELIGWRTVLSIEQGIHDALKWREIRNTVLKY